MNRVGYMAFFLLFCSAKAYVRLGMLLWAKVAYGDVDGLFPLRPEFLKLESRSDCTILFYNNTNR